MSDYAAMIQTLIVMGYQPHVEHADCRRVASLPTPGTYCPEHEVKVLPPN